MTFSTKGVAATAVLCTGLASPPAAAQSFAMKEQAGVRWACAGIGQSERAAFAKLESQANLKLEFAGGKEGAYVANVDVVLSERAGKQAPLRFKASGPICLIEAPAGRYHVEATYHQSKASASAAVGKPMGQPGRVVLRFPEAN